MVRFSFRFKNRGKKIGLISVHEQGLDLEIWHGGPQPCWSMGVVRTDADDLDLPARAEVPRVRHWLLVLPTYLCTTRHIRLPASRPEEIAAMLEFEVPQLVPCSTQAWTWDFGITGQGADGAAEVLVILSPLSVVESALEQVRALGIEPDLVTVRAALAAVRPARGKDKAGTRLCGYARWDPGSLEFAVLDGPRLVFLRGVRVGGQGLEALAGVETEVRRSLSLLRERGICDGELPLHVEGAHPQVPQLVERLGQQATACAAGALPAAPFALLSGWWRRGQPRASCVNLLPQHRKEKDRRARRRRELLGMGLRACGLALLMLLCLKMSVWRQTRLLQQYQERLARIAPLAKKLQFLQGQLNMIRAQVQGSVSMLDIVRQMYEVLPADVTIHYLSIDQNQQVVIRAQAKRLSQAFDCIDPLERSPYLANVRQNYAHLRELEGQVLIDFELRADLEGLVVKETGR